MMDKSALVMLLATHKIKLSFDEHQALAVYLSVDKLNDKQAREPYLTLYAQGEALTQRILEQYTPEVKND